MMVSQMMVLHWPDIFAGYKIEYLLTKSPLFQFETAFSDIWFFLTPKWGGGDICSSRKTVLVFHVLDKQTRPQHLLSSRHTTLQKRHINFKATS